MPELDGKAKDAYVKAYGQDVYSSYSDKGSNKVHGRQPPEPSETPLPFSHRPDHDIESIFWVLVFTLMLALPKGPYEKPSPRFYKGVKKIREHTIDRDEDVDLRDWFFRLEPTEWPGLFHSKLSPIVGMVEALSLQVYPEYGLLNPPPEEEHLHEAFRRILLNQILSMEDDIPLTPGVSRNPNPNAPASGPR